MAGRVFGVLLRAWAVIELRQDAFDHRRIFNARNHLHRPATGLADLELNLEHALQSLRPGHRRVARYRGLLRGRRLTPTATRRGHLLP